MPHLLFIMSSLFCYSFILILMRSLEKEEIDVCVVQLNFYIDKARSNSWMKFKLSSNEVKVAESCLTLCSLWTVAHQAPVFLYFPRQEYWSGLPFPSPGDLPNPGIKPRSPAVQAGSLPAEPQGKPKNTGVGSLSLLQRLFPTQESNGGLLQCRQILYQLSYQGSPTQP